MDEVTFNEWWMAMDRSIEAAVESAGNLFDVTAEECNFSRRLLSVRPRWVEYAEALIAEAIVDNRPTELDESTLYDWLDRNAPPPEPNPDDWEY